MAPVATQNPQKSQDSARIHKPGLGVVRTPQGLLALETMKIQARIGGLHAYTTVRQTFCNHLDVPLESIYIFPLPNRAAIESLRVELPSRTLEAKLHERNHAHNTYEHSLHYARRAALLEEDRPDVFTLQIGNIAPGETVTVRLTMAMALVCRDGEATFRFPLVVAPRHIPGNALPGPQSGHGISPDTDAVPDASRISPPVWHDGLPKPIDLSLHVDLDTTGFSSEPLRANLPVTLQRHTPNSTTVTLQPGARLDRDFILRVGLGVESPTANLLLAPDSSRDTGTFALTLLPPPLPETYKPRDIIFILDTSSSMAGWKFITARRAIAHMIDALCPQDRFALYTKHTAAPSAFTSATTQHCHNAIATLQQCKARGRTSLGLCLRSALQELADGYQDREHILVLVTDGQIGNEAQLLELAQQHLCDTRICTVGIDRAVNAGFLQRLSELGRGLCELIDTEERLEEAMERIHRAISSPVLTDVSLVLRGASIEPGTVTPTRVPDLYEGISLTIRGRYRLAHPEAPVRALISATQTDHKRWRHTQSATLSREPALRAVWARAQIRKLEDQHDAGNYSCALEQQILDTSLRFGVLSRFTAFVSDDHVQLYPAPKTLHTTVQPVEIPAGWEDPVELQTFSLDPSPSSPSTYSGSGGLQTTPTSYALQCISGKYRGDEFPLVQNSEMLIGRSQDLHMVLAEALVSRQHSRLIVQENTLYIEDLGSTNGTFVNGEKIKHKRLHVGDRILVGSTIFRLTCDPREIGEPASFDEADLVALPSLDATSISELDMPETLQPDHSVDLAPAQAALRGQLEEVPLPDLLQLMSTTRKTGRLTLAQPQQSTELFLRDGRVYHARSIQNPKLSSHKVFYRTIAWERGTFVFDRDVPETFGDTLLESTGALLMEGMRLLDEIRNLPGPKLRVTDALHMRQPLVTPLRSLPVELIDTFQLVLNCVTVENILNNSAASDFETLQDLAYLLQYHYITHNPLPH